MRDALARRQTVDTRLEYLLYRLVRLHPEVVEEAMDFTPSMLTSAMPEGNRARALAATLAEEQLDQRPAPAPVGLRRPLSLILLLAGIILVAVAAVMDSFWDGWQFIILAGVGVVLVALALLIQNTHWDRDV